MKKPNATNTPSKSGVRSSLAKILAAAKTQQGLTVHELIAVMGKRGNLYAVLVLMIPFLQPIPLPGLSSFIALIVGGISLGYAIGKPPWIPKKLRNRKLSLEQIEKICAVGQRVFAFFAKYIKARGSLFQKFRGVETLNGSLMVGGALLLSLPLPIPASNFFPAASIFCLTLGTLEEDGYLLLFGYFMFFLTLCYFSLIFLLPYLGFQHLVPNFFSIFSQVPA